MKQLMVVGGVLIAAAINFMLYCCMTVASREDELMEKYRERNAWKNKNGKDLEE